MDHGREMLGEGEEEEGKWRGGGGGGGAVGGGGGGVGGGGRLSLRLPHLARLLPARFAQ